MFISATNEKQFSHAIRVQYLIKDGLHPMALYEKAPKYKLGACE